MVGEQLLSRLQYKYDKQDRLIEKLQYQEAVLEAKTVYKYDTQGNLSAQTEYGIEKQAGKTVEVPLTQIVYQYEFYPQESKD